jgi:hypothetical protein
LLFGFFFAAACGCGEAFATVPDFDFENFLVFGAGLAAYAVFDGRASALLQPFLQG